MAEIARPLRKLVHEQDSYRGGVIWAIAGATTTIRLQAAHSVIRDYTVATSSLPAGLGVGSPVKCSTTGAESGTVNMAIVSVEAGAFAPGHSPTDAAAAVAAGQFYPAAWCPGPTHYDWSEADARNARAVERAAE